MVAPQYFFSTLAQASAAIVGFVIAVAAALYSLERQRVERRTDEYREALTDFKNRYGFALMTLDSMLEGEGGDTTHEMTDDLSLNNDELEELVREEYDENPVTSLYLAHVRRVLGIFHQIGPENDYILSPDELEKLRQSVYWMYIQFNNIGDEPNSAIKEFIKEATGKHYSEHDKSAGITLFGDYGDITGFGPFQLQEWFEERRAVESEVLRPTPDEDDVLDIRDEYITGDNFWSIKILSEYLHNDFQKVRREAVGTAIDYDSGIRPVVKVSSYLILVGVILPTTFLFSAPVTLPTWFILLSQVLLLLGTLALALTLVEFVFRSAEPTNQMGETENLSKFSSVVMEILPNLPF
ncbi:hypothetical protein SY89_02699 [Halolamina pelagica]|uniref:Uncharacterized protein n=1 Tax=Halolamina pelagica TaxID=699431 RepID=A0A0P7H0Z3_9EURY|nr:hypothetical protein [Halolamina pelagica]KPN31942.1 hypothetical protein SY89_02699 [Halolamina pelagica]